MWLILDLLLIMFALIVLFPVAVAMYLFIKFIDHTDK